MLKPVMLKSIVGIERKFDEWGYTGLITDKETKKIIYIALKEVLEEYRK